MRVQPFPAADLFGPPFWHRLEEDFRITLFQVVSIITTTGFGTRDIATPYFGEAAGNFFWS